MKDIKCRIFHIILVHLNVFISGYNSRTNRTLRHTHPSPGILLCHVYSEIKLAEQTVIQARYGIEKPRAQVKYLKMAKQRLKVKKEYLADKRKGKEDIGEFLSVMGHNLASSTDVGKINEVKHTKNLRTSLIHEDDERSFNVSTWVPILEKDLSVLENDTNPYTDRVVGRKPEKSANVNERMPWSGKKCPSCNRGFKHSSIILVTLSHTKM